jgi:hypothetical protein
MEYFGWDTPFGGVFINNTSKKQILAFWLLELNFFCGAASFELRMAGTGLAVLKLFNSGNPYSRP